MANWDKLYLAETAHEKATMFEKKVIEMCDKTMPKRTMIISSDDQPFYDDMLDKLNRKKKRGYSKKKKSPITSEG